MVYKIRVSPNAKLDVRNGVDYYKKEASLKVAQNFVLDCEQTLKNIKRNPHFQIYYKDFHGLPLRNYPYIIFYQIDRIKKVISVKAVFNTNQSIDKRP